MTRYGIDTGHRYKKAGRTSSSDRATRVSSASSPDRPFEPSRSSRNAGPVAPRVSREPRFQAPVDEWPKMPPSNVYDFETAKRIHEQTMPRPAASSSRGRAGWAVSSESWKDQVPEISRPASGPSRPVDAGAAVPAGRGSYGNAPRPSGSSAAGAWVSGQRSTGFGVPSQERDRLQGRNYSRRPQGSDDAFPDRGQDVDFRRGRRQQGFDRQRESSRQQGFDRHVPESRRQAQGFRSQMPESRKRAQESRSREQEEPRRSRRQEPESSGLRAKLEKRRRESRHKRADKDFETHVPQDRAEADTQAQAPRAGVYKGEMGRNQKRAQRMQGSAGGFSLPFAIPGIPLGKLAESPRLSAVLMVAACLVLSIMFVYPSAQDYYITLRTNAQMEAELAAINQRNDEIAQRVAVLQTDEGVEDKLRNDLGWVNEGENAVSVSRDGSAEISASASEKSAAVVAGSVPAPDTWYSGILDVIFGYDNTPVSSESADGQEDATLTSADDGQQAGDDGADDGTADDGKADDGTDQGSGSGN